MPAFVKVGESWYNACGAGREGLRESRNPLCERGEKRWPVNPDFRHTEVRREGLLRRSGGLSASAWSVGVGGGWDAR